MGRTRKRRSGFTLVELLVAAALTLFIMSIIGVAFQKSMDTFRVLRSVTLMQEKLKSAQLVLKRDLASEHFGGTFRDGFSGPYVRDQRLDLVGWIPPDEGFFRLINGDTTVPPQLTPNHGNPESVDTDGLRSFIGLAHSMHFTVKLRGNRDDEMFIAAAPTTIFYNKTPVNFNPPDFPSQGGNEYFSRWAEIYYFLAPNGQFVNNNPSNPLFTLYRRQRLALPKDVPPFSNPATWPPTIPWATAQVASLSLPTNFPDISFSTASANVNTSADLTNPANRMPVTAIPNASALGGQQNTAWFSGLASQTTLVPQYNYGTLRIMDIVNSNPSTFNATIAGDDILLSDVLSFEIKANWSIGQAGFNTSTNVTTPTPGSPASTNINPNQDWPFDLLPISNYNPNATTAGPNSNSVFTAPGTNTPSVFDTWSTSAVGQLLNWNDPTTWALTNTPPPLRVRVNSLQIRIRVWDANAQQARQITMIQDI